MRREEEGAGLSLLSSLSTLRRSFPLPYAPSTGLPSAAVAGGWNRLMYAPDSGKWIRMHQTWIQTPDLVRSHDSYPHLVAWLATRKHLTKKSCFELSTGLGVGPGSLARSRSQPKP